MRSQNVFRLGLAFAVGSALAFGVSGPLAKALMAAGWSPTAAVLARLAGGALAVALVATVLSPGWVREALTHRRTVVLYGLVPIAGAQLCYYNAVAHLSVGVALLLEYLAPVLVVGWVWARTRVRPTGLILGGAALALIGTVLVLNPFSDAHIDAVGVAWALAAAVCAACYFVMSAKVADDGSALTPITLAASGLIVAAAAVAVLGTTGVMPLAFSADDTVVAGHTTSVVVPVVVMGIVSTAIAYILGICGVARLQPGYASLVGLGEVLCAVAAAWVLLGEAVTPAQAVGSAVVLLGLALAGRSDTPAAGLDTSSAGLTQRPVAPEQSLTAAVGASVEAADRGM